MATKTRLRVGSLVTWKHRGGSASGKIIKIIKTGKCKIPNSSLIISADEDNPAALIMLFKNNEPTKTVVGHKLKSLKPVRKK